jgi:hypothetical protein
MILSNISKRGDSSFHWAVVGVILVLISRGDVPGVRAALLAAARGQPDEVFTKATRTFVGRPCYFGSALVTAQSTTPPVPEGVTPATPVDRTLTARGAYRKWRFYC